MLKWMSETGAGSVADLRTKLAWLAHTEDVPASRAATGRWIRDMSALGHAEVAWHADRWSVAPSVITPLPCSDGIAVLAGRRRAGLVDRLERTNVAVTIYQPEAGPGSLPVPAAVFAQYDDLDGLTTAAVEAGLAYSACSARMLAQRLPPVQLGDEAPPPAFGNPTLQRFSTDEMIFLPAGAEHDGLYRVRLHGSLRHLYRLNGTWQNCERAAGTFIEYGRVGRVSVIRFRPERDYPSGPVGSVFIDGESLLPALPARALTMCSGLPPHFSQAARTTTYANVPASVAFAVAESLQQRIQPC